MARKKNTTNLTELLLQCVTQPDPMLSMLEWLCTELMEAEVDQQLGRREKPAHGRQERLPQRLSSTPSGYSNGHDVPHGAQGSSGRLHLRSSPQSASAVKRCSYRWFRKPLCKACLPGKWRSWHIASALKVYPEVRSVR